MYHIFFTYSSVSGYLGCFHGSAIVNSAAVNIEVHVSFRTMFFSGYMPRSGTAGSYRSSVFSGIFLILFFKILFIYLFLAVLGLGCCESFSLVASSRGYCPVEVPGFSLQWFLSLRSMGSRGTSFSSSGVWAQWLQPTGFRAQAQ